MTREEWLNEQVLKLANEEILTRIRKRENIGEIFGKIGFLYSCCRIHPLELLMILSRVMKDNEFNEVMKIFKEENYCVFTAQYINEERDK